MNAPKPLKFPDDWYIAHHFDPRNPEAMRGWCLYMLKGVEFMREHVSDSDQSTKRVINGILKAMNVTCRNILDTYDEAHRIELENLKEAQDKLGREFQ